MKCCSSYHFQVLHAEAGAVCVETVPCLLAFFLPQPPRWFLKMSTKKYFFCLFPELNKNPVEGFSAGLIDDDDIYKWEVVIIGPQDTLL